MSTRRNVAKVVVDSLVANGEIGFKGPLVVHLDEPDYNPSPYDIVISRNGTSGDAWVDWEIFTNNPLLQLNVDFLAPNNQTIFIPAGSESATLSLRILPDEIPELDEEFTIKLKNARPTDSQRVSLENSLIRIIIRENDNPAGEFEISDPSGLIDLREGQDPIALTVRRTGGWLAERRIEVFAIEDVNRTEFVGLPTVIEFRERDKNHTISFMAAKDNVPELKEHFTISIRPFRDSPITINSHRSKLSVAILKNDDPHGVFQFSQPGISMEVREGGEAEELVVTRAMGTFGAVDVHWNIEFIPDSNSAVFAEPSQQFRFSEGVLHFGENDTQQSILISAKDDDIPEPHEHYQIRLVSVTNGGSLSPIPANTVADLHIIQNDYKIEFGGPNNKTVREGTSLQLDILRENVTSTCSIRVSTVDGTAKASRDFTPLSAQLLVFQPMETHKQLWIDIDDDDEPEAAETFKVVLSDATGECVAYGNKELTITIASNDEASGVFRFEPPAMYDAIEGRPLKIGVLREKSYFDSVTLLWRMVTPAGCKEFSPKNGSVTFVEGQIVSKFEVTAVDDEIPEFNETYEVELYKIINAESARILEDGNRAAIVVVENDQPHGLLTFPHAFREQRVHEDYLPGFSRNSMLQLDVKRLRGLNGTIRAVWEMYSYEIAGKIPPFRDLLLDAHEHRYLGNDQRRPDTFTDVFELNGRPAFLPRRRIPGHDFFSEGFGISFWIKPDSTALGTPGFLFSKVESFSGQMEFGVAIQIGFPHELIIQVKTKSYVIALPTHITNGNWSFFSINYFDKIDSKIDQPRMIKISLNGKPLPSIPMEYEPFFDIGINGQIIVGTDNTGGHPSFALVQDFRLYSRPLQDGELFELFMLPSRKDIRPVNGYVQFATGQEIDHINLATVDDGEEEANEVFSVKLMDVSGGAEILSSDGSSKVTVLKSDNANGLFLLTGCHPDSNIIEGFPVNCTIERQRGDADIVTLSWHINEVKPDGYEILADSDFEQAKGTIVFPNGVREMVLQLMPKKDGDAESAERFILLLEGVTVADGEIGSTPTSGASINADFDRTELWIKPNDWPNGLFQFCSNFPCPKVERPIKPITNPHPILVREEIGTFTLVVHRSQGLMGKVTVEFRTVDGAAKAHADYQAAAGYIGLEEGEDSAEINITIFDNNLPEQNKEFYVELLNPTGGAQINPVAGKVKIIIAESDYPHGMFNFEESSCGKPVYESDGSNLETIALKIVRNGGTLKEAKVNWKVNDEAVNDVKPSSGTAVFRAGQKVATVLVEVVDDVEPELPELITFQLIDSDLGVVAADVNAKCNFTIGANDDPFGVFYIPSQYRPFFMNEHGEILLNVTRRAGNYGKVKIGLRVFSYKDELPENKRPLRLKAKFDKDFETRNRERFLVDYFDEGVHDKIIPIGVIKDDDEPEDNESFFVMITQATVVGNKFRKLALPDNIRDRFLGKPKIADIPESIAEYVIRANDDAHGLLSLSHDKVTVREGRQVGPDGKLMDFTDFPLKIVRDKGSFGKVSVKFKFGNGTALEHQDFIANGGFEVWLDSNEMEKSLPILIVDDLMPEDEEVFSVSLIPESATGGASVGGHHQAFVTIEASDSPHGMLVFRQPAHQNIEEPIGNRVLVDNIIVKRKQGLQGVIKAHWVAVNALTGETAKSDVFPANGTVFFNTGADTASISIYVLADEVPEIDETIEIRLIATDGAELGPSDEIVYRLTILANDNPFGTVELMSNDSLVWENSKHQIGVKRTGGTFGTLSILYTVEALNISDILNVIGESAKSFFDLDFVGYRRSTNLMAFSTHEFNDFDSCVLKCLSDMQCEAFDVGTEGSDMGCRTWTVGFRFNPSSDKVPNNHAQYWTKKKHRADELLYGRWAVGDGVDFVSGTFSKSMLPEEANVTLDVKVISDGVPELNETFRVRLEAVQLINWTTSEDTHLNAPTIGEVDTSLVTILQNNDANGRLALSLLSGGNYVEVDEADRAIEFVITRLGGAMGFVSVTWAVDRSMSTATPITDTFDSGDFTGDSATLYFAPGVTVQSKPIFFISL